MCLDFYRNLTPELSEYLYKFKLVYDSKRKMNIFQGVAEDNGLDTLRNQYRQFYTDYQKGIISAPFVNKFKLVIAGTGKNASTPVKIIEPIAEPKVESDSTQKEVVEFEAAYKLFKQYYVEDKAGSTSSKMGNNINHLKAFCALEDATTGKKKIPVCFSSFTVSFGTAFKNYLYAKGNSQGTVYNVTKGISTFLNWCFEHEEKLNPYNHFKKWRVSKPQTDRKYLKEPQLMELLKYPLKEGSSFDRTRDAWMFMAFSGMRVSDYMLFDEAWLVDGEVNYFSKKAKKHCIVPLNPITEALVKKYNGKLPKQAATKMNKNIKLILAKMGYDKIRITLTILAKVNKVEYTNLAKAITIHSARRSFINLMIQKGVLLSTIGVWVGNDLPSLLAYYKKDTTNSKNAMAALKFDTGEEQLQIAA